jgi:hypothetical protein
MKFFHDISRIWSAFVERILYLLDPHKVDDEKEYLRMQIQIERNERQSLLEMFSTKKEESESNVDVSITQPVNPYIPWRVRRAQLEFEHRLKKSDPPGTNSDIDTKSGKSKTQLDIEQLEEELEISNAD